jgi:hypothetical protein
MLAIYREGVGKRPDALRMPGPRAGPVAPGMWTRRKQVPANDVPPRWGAVGSLQIAGRSCKRHGQTALGKVKWARPCRPWRGAPSQPKEGESASAGPVPAFYLGRPVSLGRPFPETHEPFRRFAPNEWSFKWTRIRNTKSLYLP